jgi:hypothetical protein
MPKGITVDIIDENENKILVKPISSGESNIGCRTSRFIKPIAIPI